METPAPETSEITAQNMPAHKVVLAGHPSVSSFAIETKPRWLIAEINRRLVET